MNTHVCAHSSSWSTKQQSVCQRVSIGWFCARHVWSEKHTCVCPQQQLVGQPLTLGCSPELTSSATHMWVLTAAIGLPKLLKVQNLHLTSSLGYSANTCVCSQQHLVDQPSVVLFCNTCVYVLTAAIGLPKLFKWSKLQVTCSAPDMCVQKHTCVCPQAAIGRPTFDPWVQPSMDCF